MLCSVKNICGRAARMLKKSDPALAKQIEKLKPSNIRAILRSPRSWHKALEISQVIFPTSGVTTALTAHFFLNSAQQKSLLPDFHVQTCACVPVNRARRDRMGTDEKLLSTEEAAALLGTTPGTLAAWRCTRKYA